ncbi:MAG: hypothetical protein JNM59_10380 [Hyphomonadaceae bacterium]|nr:hypothetical protein [Hyphomonadaceae bacterium]
MRWILLLLVVAGVAGYFTRPEEPAMRSAAEAVLSDPATLGELMQGVGAQVAGDRQYNNYYVAAKYTVSLSDAPVVECWGAFTQVQCQRVEEAAQ